MVGHGESELGVEVDRGEVGRISQIVRRWRPLSQQLQTGPDQRLAYSLPPERRRHCHPAEVPACRRRFGVGSGAFDDTRLAESDDPVAQRGNHEESV